MTDVREERRLAAIVIGDVVGYSRMMGQDEIGTMSALKAHRRELILPLLATYRARLVNTTGDAMLLEFGSAVDAVSCAANLQRGMQARAAGVAADRQIRFRLGINLGDIVIDGNDIDGDGVNVAARLETMCEPGGLCLSRAVEEQVKDKLPYVFEDRGEQELKNIARPVRVFALTPEAIASLPEPILPREPRLAGTTRLQVGTGTRLNDAYAIDRLVGSGGMGEIYQGHEIHTGDAVAIKLIRLDMEANEAALGLFQKEASVLKHVYHEAVVRYYVFSFDQAVGRHYLAMEFVDGPSLSELMRRGPLAFEAVDALRKRVAAGLQIAHERGVVHRDISPDNIILPDGDVTRAKIIDFGIARAAALGGGTIIGGGFAGKYNYVSPEQLGLFGAEVTGRSDIYSLGLVLAGALLGHALDMAGSQIETIEKRRTVPDLAGIDDRLRPLIAAMLQPEPERRPATMAEVAQWRDSPPAPVFDPPPTSAPPAIAPRATAAAAVSHRPSPERTPSRWRWIVGGSLAAVIVAAGGLTALNWSGRTPQPSRPSPTLTPEPSATPTPSEPGSAPAAPEAPQQPTTAPVPPPSGSEPSPEQPSAIKSPAIPVPPAPPQPATPPAAASNAAQRVDAFLRAYDGGPCFYATAVTVTERSAGIQAFTATAEAFDTFAKLFTAALGFEPALIGNRLWSKQCPAAAFLRQAGATGGPTPNLFVKSTRLRSGQTLSGAVSRADDAAVLLLRVREDGSVEDLSKALKTRGDDKEFDVALSQQGSGPYPQLIIAIASDQPLPAPAAGQTADQVFQTLLKGAADRKQALGVNAKLVLLGG